MQTPDDGSLSRGDVDRLVRAVRDASGPALDDGAARRIADGAWERARPSPGRRPWRVPRALRRYGVAAAAVLVAAVGFVAVRPTEPAFAVDGGSVKVWKNDRWEETRSVSPGTTVFVADADRVLRGPGAEITPSAGTTLRIAIGDAHHRFRVEILTGAAEVDGRAVRLSLGDLDVEPGLRGHYRAYAALPASETQGAPAAPPSGAALAMASIRIEVGDAILTRRSTGERMDLMGGRAIALVPDGDAKHTFRLCRVSEFGPDTELRIASGQPVVEFLGFGDEGMVLLNGLDGRLAPVSVRKPQLDEAVAAINEAMHVLATRMGNVRGRPGAMNVAIGVSTDTPREIPLELRAFSTGKKVSELTSVLDGRRVRVVIVDGQVTVKSDGSTRSYDSVDAAREAEDDSVNELLEHVAD